MVGFRVVLDVKLSLPNIFYLKHSIKIKNYMNFIFIPVQAVLKY
tara:strand:- start:106 stop:237 length:132 start_codon:yes stop_codon:yes gene_type:complete